MSGWIGTFGERAFDVAVTPTVTAGAYSGGDIVGDLLTFPVLQIPNNPILISGVLVTCKAAVTPDLRLVLFNGNPTNTTTTDNAAYSLNTGDMDHVLGVVDLSTETWSDHGTPNTINKESIGLIADLAADSVNLYGLLIDDTGATLTSTSDITVRVRGISS